MFSDQESVQVMVDVFEHLPDAILIIDNQGNIIHHNSRALTVFGYSKNELVGKSIGSLLPERFRDKHEQYIRQYFEHHQVRKMGQGLNLWGLKKNGEELDVDIALSPLIKNRKHYVIVVVREIGDKLKLENQIGSLEKIKEELERFAYVVSHDLKSPFATH